MGGHPYLIVESESITHKSAFTAEMLMQVLVSNFSTAPRLLTDCQPALQVVTEGRKKPSRIQDPSIFRAIHGDSRLKWTESHPEKHQPDRSWWSADDTGIDRADAVAGLDWQRYIGWNRDTTGLTITDTEALRALGYTLQRPFISDMNGVISFEDPGALHRRRIRAEYLELRDGYAAAGKGSISPTRMEWKEVSTSLVWDLHKRMYGSYNWGIVVKIAFDKDWHKANQCKGRRCPVDHMDPAEEQPARCDLCGKGVEDQEHWIWHCSHPGMQAMRSMAVAHLNDSADKVSLLPDSPTKSALERLHKLLMRHSNYSLMFGRVHREQRKLLQGLVLPGSSVRRRTLIAHWRLYSAMVFTMHTTRHLLLLYKDNPTQQAKVVSEFALRQRNKRGLEIIYGIQRSTVVTASGEVVRSAPADLAGVGLAGERKVLDYENSAPIRELLTKGTQVSCTVKASGAKSKGKKKPPTAMELMGGRFGTQEAEEQAAQPRRPSDWGFEDLGHDPQADRATLLLLSTKLRRPEPTGERAVRPPSRPRGGTSLRYTPSYH